MDAFRIRGGRRLEGHLRVNGSKNSVLPILAASILADKGKSIIHDIPDLRDIRTILQLLEAIGCKINWDKKEKTVEIDAENLTDYVAPYELVSKMRASFLVLGPLLARLGKAKVSLPGGCSLGQRPVDLHIKGFKKLGATVVEEAGYVLAECDRLDGGSFCFDRPSHTGTENIMMGAVTASGTTTIINAAMDPEVVDVANFLNSMGASIEGAGTATITIKGVKKLTAIEHKPIPDRLVAGTFMAAVAASGGEATLENVKPSHLGIVIQKFNEMGCVIEFNHDRLTIRAPKRLRAVDIVTIPYPGFPTDLQACIMSMATMAEGTTRIRETIFEDRFSHAMELIRLGAKITISGDTATIEGVENLSGTNVMASDIRAGAAMVVAGLAAEGETEVKRVYHIDRGYENFEESMAAVGADIERVKD
ncbi:MAG: UDP-N-acetylglucosamine 1-carboxyvinyltransferase [candidate division Zixibacteria bacterium]|nr:UDP-N-acetylglucosamine 1-carboxyvinyltransferase [candidate division Zixibacteria bacterium]NIR66062.1 UDP-N-acetylglucosamine 1-carboxyvinyltransferase [candidate division Zixibacteria bacterium]NIS17146.1 UDP-N-acetylglucosamine 1-carboxyvinyltransferase [candidate division Zixibacteria bacterium]NIS47692.1 UDP-N-acetylglucosamine 1-carboxyvinyltransferase [candidate division Zixibacteria bacterium]NIT53501.1 UDP-N-acetylglucosamine 1-carboxyvinyltransferase [candidate division Zixibacter